MAEGDIGFSMKSDGDTISFERTGGRDKRRLSCTKDLCVGCGICAEACPVNAIEVGPAGAIVKGVVDTFKITIDPDRCVLCGICAGVCPFNAITLEVNGEPMEAAGDRAGYRQVFEFDQEKCGFHDDGTLCDDCEKACPRDAIKCEIKDGRNTIEFDRLRCSYCTACETACPKDAIRVEKPFQGEVLIDQEACQGCGACQEICPNNSIELPKAVFGEKTDKVVCNTDTCVFCGACQKVCPVDAITVKRKQANYEIEGTRSWTRRWERAFNELLEEAEE
jgi:4Fe-4S ferredoxin